MSTRKLILIDGTSVLYRAYFAIRDLSTSAGRPTNAVFGFIRMLRQIEEDWKPTHWVVVFDGGLPEERIELLEEYKAQRRPMPESLREQIQTVEEYLDRADIAWLRQEGQEADDIMASVAAWAEKESGETLIATNDKDLYQLVDEKVRVIPVSGKSSQLGPEDILLKTGVFPLQIVDWLALVGDTSDNIKGVPGVGPKTAAKLLSRYGSLDDLWAHLDELPSDKLRNSLRENRSLISRNVQMVRLRRDLGCPLEWDGMQARPASPDKLLPFFEMLEFESMARELREQQHCGLRNAECGMR